MVMRKRDVMVNMSAGQTLKRKRPRHGCGQQIVTGRIRFGHCAGKRKDRIAAQIAHRPGR